MRKICPWERCSSYLLIDWKARGVAIRSRIFDLHWIQLWEHESSLYFRIKVSLSGRWQVRHTPDHYLLFWKHWAGWYQVSSPTLPPLSTLPWASITVTSTTLRRCTWETLFIVGVGDIEQPTGRHIYGYKWIICEARNKNKLIWDSQRHKK